MVATHFEGITAAGRANTSTWWPIRSTSTGTARLGGPCRCCRVATWTEIAVPGAEADLGELDLPEQGDRHLRPGRRDPGLSSPPSRGSTTPSPTRPASPPARPARPRSPARVMTSSTAAPSLRPAWQPGHRQRHLWRRHQHRLGHRDRRGRHRGADDRPLRLAANGGTITAAAAPMRSGPTARRSARSSSTTASSTVTW